MHQYQQEFNENFELGFALSEYPFLVDKSWHNDTSPSFYFKTEDTFLVLWVDYPSLEDRDSDNPRYVIMKPENTSDSRDPELYCGSGEVVFESESIIKLDHFLKVLFRRTRLN